MTMDHPLPACTCACRQRTAENPTSINSSSISSFTGRHWVLSNFSRSEVLCNGISFPTVEHAFQAQKEGPFAVLFIERIGKVKSAGAAKAIGKKATLRQDWELVKDDLMLDLLRQKFAPGTARALRLLETTGCSLVDGNTWHDTYWGVCYCRQCKGRGSNMLGRLLEQVREELNEM